MNTPKEFIEYEFFSYKGHTVDFAKEIEKRRWEWRHY